VTKFILRRIVRGLVALMLFQTLLFALIHALPYDFSAFFVGSPGWRAFIQSYLGLDRPWYEQLFSWLGGFFRFDLGRSFMSWPTAVSEMLLRRAPRTLILFLSGALLAYVFGIWLGKMIAWRRGGLFESGVTVAGVATYTSFSPWFGFVMLTIFAFKLGWFPYQKLIDHNVWYKAEVSTDWLLSRMLLTGVLTYGALALIFRVTRKLKEKRRRWILRIVSGALTAGVVWWWWARSGHAFLATNILEHLMLPLITVVLLSFGETMLLMRTTMLETINEEYVLMARAKGLPENVVRDRHVARNAILPVMTRLLLNLPFVLIGSLSIELVFQWEAMGQLIFDAIDFQDIPVLMGVLSTVGVLALVAHVVLDILYVYLDPRLRYQEGN
jgi:peptide/nickel transport system permease protein